MLSTLIAFGDVFIDCFAASAVAASWEDHFGGPTVEGGMKALPAEFHNFAHDLCSGLHLGCVFLQIFRINKRSDL